MLLSVVGREQLELVEQDAYAGGGGSLALHRVRAAGGQPFLFKEYRPGSVDRPDVLHRLVRWRAGLAEDERRLLDSSAAFPVAVVVDEALVVGVLLPEAGPEFVLVDRRGRARPRPLDRMAMTSEHAGRVEHTYYEPPHKLAVLGHLLRLLGWLHERGVIVGDLNAENVLVTADPGDARCFLLDCDSLWIDGVSAFARHEAPTMVCWFRVGQPFSRESDLYKFAVLALRCLHENNADTGLDLARLNATMPTEERTVLLALLEPGGAASPAEVERMADAWRGRATSVGELLGLTDGGHFLWDERPLVWGRALAVAAAAAFVAMMLLVGVLAFLLTTATAR